MYIPPKSFLNQDGSPPAQRKPRRRNRGRSKLLGLAAAAIAVAVLAVGIALSGTDNASRGTTAVLEHDLQVLWGWSDNVLEGGAASADWTIRWDVELPPSSVPGQLADALLADERGRVAERIVTNDGKSITAQLPNSGGAVLAIHETERTNTGVAFFLVLEWKGVSGESSAGGNRLETMLAAAGKLREAAETEAGAEAGAEAVRTSLKVRGMAKSAGAAKEIERLSLSEKLEEYEDGGSVVATYWSSELKHAQQLDTRRKANLQMSAHSHTELGAIELTVGIPLITGDFGAVAGEAAAAAADKSVAATAANL